MILDPKLGHTGFTTWHCEYCRVVKDVLWVDTDTAQWGTFVGVDWVNRCLIEVTHQEKRIDVLLERKLVLINPIEDEESSDEQINQCISVA